jgi:hypothetical protein
MTLREIGRSIWNALSHLSTAVWLVGLASAFIAAARTGAGWLQNPFVLRHSSGLGLVYGSP